MAVDIRKGMPSTHLEREEFEKRFRQQFFDPAFDKVEAEIAKIAEIAWQSYDGYNKNPRKQRAGEGFADPDFELPVEWLAAREAIRQAEMRQKDPASPSRILIVNGSSRSDQTCPGEISKTWRLVQMCRELVAAEKDFEVEVLDLSLLASEADKRIFPCKACVSTAQPLCHWPCTCYPNFALGQVNDWMAEIYPKWVAAHGVMIVTPVNWYQAPSSLKLMIDRLVCADGGNSDPTTTKMKHVAPAKELELAGWPYPRHLAGRAFSVAVHGDAAGVENLRRILCDWMSDIGMIPCGHKSQFGAYVGYLEPYATSHKDLDEDTDFQEDVKNSAHALINGVKMLRKGELRQPDATLEESRPK
ncbi:MAG: flavodoxin family protein [Xanthobacteraceae bacterium]|nr:flavodoxin family protein [Xanthobacteraceae bacterium]MCW5675833.1 flavodoxin family protein [Xanthobacteraceae bacterium]MCW5679119.1 flavodoxin family protein [Xanthobacteraceae bacterium]